MTRAGRVRRLRVDVPVGTTVRHVVRDVGESPEGTAVLVGETPVPLDLPIETAVKLTVVPTFSGG